MDLTVALDLRYSATPDGSVWSEFGMARQFWERYLEVFDRVRVVARVSRVDSPREGWLPVIGENITVHAVPDFHGPLECLKRYPSVRAAIRSAVPTRGAVILRVGSQIANMLEGSLISQKRPYALEVVGDPYDVFAPGVVNHPLRLFFRWHFSRRLRRQCRSAAGVAYVTRRALQQRYPARCLSESISDVDLPAEAILGSAFSTNYSSVELQTHDFATGAHSPKERGPYRLVMVGSLAQHYKGTDVLIKAVALCVRGGWDLTAVIVGDGQYRHELMALAERVGMSSRIQFAGQVSAGEPVRQILDTADLFVMPSRTEGLPRALIEAMARGLPCVGSAVGGIPELLDDGDLVPSSDPVVLAGKIREVLSNPSRMVEMSQRNLECARRYSVEILAERRRRFYQYVREKTEAWELRKQR